MLSLFLQNRNSFEVKLLYSQVDHQPSQIQLFPNHNPLWSPKVKWLPESRILVSTATLNTLHCLMKSVSIGDIDLKFASIFQAGSGLNLRRRAESPSWNSSLS